MADQQILRERFAEARQELERLTAGSVPLNHGDRALAIDHGDGTVSKLYLRFDGAAQQKQEQAILKEAEVLTKFSRAVYTGMQLPSLVDEPASLDAPHFFGALRMSKVPGRHPEWSWDKGSDPKTIAAERAHFRSVGRLLANFHAVALQADVVPPRSLLKDAAPDVSLGQRANEGLARGLAYLDAHRRPGIAHRAIHDENMLESAAGEATGLIDLHTVGYSPNVYLDLIDLPEEFQADAAAGYGEVSGVRLNPVIFTLEDVLLVAQQMQDLPRFSDNWNYHDGRLRKLLNKAHAVTGYRP